MPGRPSATKPPIAQYIALSLLFLWALVYQVQATEFYFPAWFHNYDAVSMPFHTSNYLLTYPSDAIGTISKAAQDAGVRSGDVLLAVNGRPLKGLGVYNEELAKAHPGETLQVTVRPPQAPGAATTLSITLRQRAAKPDFWTAYFDLFLPGFCLLLGFWVAAVRPRDPLAWLVLALMLSFTGALYDPSLGTSQPKLSDFV